MLLPTTVQANQRGMKSHDINLRPNFKGGFNINGGAVVMGQSPGVSIPKLAVSAPGVILTGQHMTDLTIAYSANNGGGNGNGCEDDKKGESNGELPGRNDALNQAKRDAGIPKNQQPDKVEKVPMRSAPHEGGHVIKDANGNVIYTREYHYTNSNGQKIIIQEYSAGHTKGGQGPHFNVRPVENPRTGSVQGTKDHYPFKK